MRFIVGAQAVVCVQGAAGRAWWHVRCSCKNLKPWTELWPALAGRASKGMQEHLDQTETRERRGVYYRGTQANVRLLRRASNE